MSKLLLNSLRSAIAAFGCFSAIFLPPWVPIICIILLALRWRAWEAILIGLLVDLLWLPTSFIGHIPLFTLLALAIVWLLEPLRKEFLSDF